MCRIIMAVVVWVGAQAQWSPNRFPSVWEREAWQEREMELLIKNMTLELLDDVTQKLTMADKVREIHQKSITFELGAIAAGVMERYWLLCRRSMVTIEMVSFHERINKVTVRKWKSAILSIKSVRYWQMINIYKIYADLQTFTANTYYTRTMYDMYARIRGLYYEIRLEIRLFAEIKQKHESTKPARTRTTPVFGKLDPNLLSNIDPKVLATLDPKILATMDPRVAQMIGARRASQKWKAPEK